MVNRNRLFYCTHQNRKNAFFKRHNLNAKDVETEALAERIIQEQIGFARIRRSLKDKLLKIVKTVVEN